MIGGQPFQVSFAVHGWTLPKIRSRRRILAVHEWTGFAVHWWTAVAKAQKINEPTIAALLGLPRKSVHSWSAKKSTDEARVLQ
jgi:hypothetical protein